MRIPEMEKFFTELLNENRLVYARKFDILKLGRSHGEFIEAAFQALSEEIAYIKTEQAFREVFSTQQVASVGPILGEDNKTIATSRSLPQSGEINLGGYFFGSNWHSAEWDPERKKAFRWTDGPIGNLRVAMSRARPSVLEFVCLYLAPGVIDDTLNIQINGNTLPTDCMASSTGITYRAELPDADDLLDEHDVAIVCPRSVRLSDVDKSSGDPRSLGVAVTAFRFYPLAAR